MPVGVFDSLSRLTGIPFISHLISNAPATSFASEPNASFLANPLNAIRDHRSCFGAPKFFPNWTSASHFCHPAWVRVPARIMAAFNCAEDPAG
jgi:hypothetical protein